MLSTIERIAPTQTASQNHNSTLVVIDSAVADCQLLVAGIEPTAQVIILDQQQDSITQITAAVNKNKISSLQLIAHGSSGSLQLGKITLNLDNLHSYQQQLQNWQVEEILIYGCEVAAGERGKAFINQLHQLTGANIAASEQKIGNSQLEGSWELAVKIGQISSNLNIKPEVQENYPHVLTDFGLIWATNFGNSYFSEVRNMTVDSAGNVYTTGLALAMGDFQPSNGVYLDSTQEYIADAYISKVNSDGSLAWAFSFGNFNGSEYGLDVAVDSAGNVYGVGFFQNTVDFDPGSGTFNLTSNAETDTFIVKLNSDGSFAWAANFGNGNGSSVAVDNESNVYTAGRFSGTVDFDPGIGTFNLTSNGLNDVFISKLDTDGNFVWARNFGGDNFISSSDIAVDNAGNVYTMGHFGGTVDFDPDSGTFNLTSNGEGSVFISKLNSDGSFAWAASFGSSFTRSENIAVDSAGNVYITGGFYGTIDADPGSGVFNLTSNESNNAFIVKLNNDGSFAWATNFGGSNYSNSQNLFIDSADNVYVSGSFSGAVDFDPSSNIYTLTSNGGSSPFLVKLNSDRSLVWAKMLGGDKLAIDNNTGNIYGAGTFSGTRDFDPGSGTVNLTTSYNLRDIYVTKFGLVPNSTPTLVNPIADQSIVTGFMLNFTLDANTFADADAGDVLAYRATLANGSRLPRWLTFNPNTRTFTGTPVDANVGSINIRVIATDSVGAFVDDVFVLNILAPTVNGLGRQQNFYIPQGKVLNIENFGGIGKGVNPSAATILEVDTIKFTGANFTARNMLLTQNGDDLEITFAGDNITKVVLKDFALENLENLQRSTGATVDLGNITFNGQTEIQDNFDVFDANSTHNSIWNPNTVTFLNDLDNQVNGFDSDDVINGQDGNDTINGLAGNDLLRGGLGNDTLIGGKDNDTLVGDAGQDYFQFSTGISFNTNDLGIDTISDFVSGTDKIVLGINTFTQLNSPVGGGLVALNDFAIVSDFTNAAVEIATAKIVYNLGTGGLFYNENGAVAGFGNGGQFATLANYPTITASDFLVL